MPQQTTKTISTYYSQVDRDVDNRIISRKALSDHIREVAQVTQGSIAALPNTLPYKKERTFKNSVRSLTSENMSKSVPNNAIMNMITN